MNKKQCPINPLVHRAIQAFHDTEVAKTVNAFLLPIYTINEERTQAIGEPVFNVRLRFIVDIPNSELEHHYVILDTKTDEHNCIKLKCITGTSSAELLLRCRSGVKWPQPRNTNIEDLFYTWQTLWVLKGHHRNNPCIRPKGSAITENSVNKNITRD